MRRVFGEKTSLLVISSSLFNSVLCLNESTLVYNLCRETCDLFFNIRQKLGIESGCRFVVGAAATGVNCAFELLENESCMLGVCV